MKDFGGQRSYLTRCSRGRCHDCVAVIRGDDRTIQRQFRPMSALAPIATVHSISRNDALTHIVAVLRETPLNYHLYNQLE